MSNLLGDLRYALRNLRKGLTFTAAAVLSLGLGIGANTTIFSLIHAVFLNPLPLAEPSRLVSLFTVDQRFPGFSPTSFLNYEDLRDQNVSFSGLAAYMVARLNLSSGGEPQQVIGAIVSDNYFDVLGVEISRGRAFLPEEGRTPGSHAVAVLGHGLWSRRFGADEALLGQSIQLNGRPFLVVGIAPPGFRGTNLLEGTEVWVPLMMHEQVLTGFFRRFFNERRALLLQVVGRLRDGVSAAGAQADVDAISRRLAEQYPIVNEKRSVDLVPLTTFDPARRSDTVLASAVLMLVVGFVLLIACANVANLLLTRATGRRRELAVRLALGAGARQLFRLLIFESLLLSLAGAGVAFVVAALAHKLLWTFRPPVLAQAAIDLRFELPVAAFTVGIALLSGLLFGLAPALHAARLSFVTALRTRGEVSSGGRFGVLSLRHLLVAAQAALTVVALVGAGLFLRSLWNAQRIDPGFESESHFVISFDLEAQAYERARGEAFQRRILERATSLPGVESASLASNIPLSNVGGFQRSIVIEGREPPPGVDGIFVVTNVISPEHFVTLGIPLLYGRPFDDRDREDGQTVMIINRTMAEHYWPGEDPSGQRFSFFGDPSPRTVIGVVADSKNFTLGEEIQSTVYLPQRQNYAPAMTLFVRAAGNPGALLRTVEREVQQLDPGLPLVNTWTLSEVLDRSLWAPRMAATLLEIFGLLALVLAVIGIYGVTAYTISQQQREIGIRMALGARRLDVLMLFLKQGMAVVAAGILVGLGIASALSRGLSGLLYGIGRFDPVTFMAIPVLLALVALAALALTARRAATLDPVRVLRLE